MEHTIIIADDHPLFRTALQAALRQGLQNPEIHEAGSIAALQSVLQQVPSPDLILLDLHMPGAHGFSGLIFLRGHYPEVPVAIVSATEDQQVIQRAMQHGANGFIPKSSPLDTLKEAITHVLDGEVWLPGSAAGLSTPQATHDIEQKLASLTPQQFRVLGMISEGMLNKQIAYDLEVSEATIKAHVTAIFKKLGVRNRTQAVIAMKELEIDQPGNQNDSQTLDD
ncbi:LuxR family transcriptional regulator [Endozoicomonas montiporae]|uniref:LuxR family transcriptional regulator n=2 Tax=Endozoicomonas montiporae TaxID=1027273 RepID=A0A081NBF7_9GAMM|nr:response regulator transcription factor [Endozoicomonas montiporae]AMO56061.1 positive activator for glycerol metabolism [Endozoicomonas montiporae CL-33]KEQ15780.1 LuxR family transcriptional regulator [Endozoicomonas montiporae]